MRFRALNIVSCAALAGALAFAASPAAQAEETNPCFTGEGTVKEVLDGCAAFIASGSTDKDQLVRAHSVRAMAFSAVRNIDAAIAELDEAVKLDATKPNSYFMRAAALAAKKDFDKAIADLDEAIKLDGKHGDFSLLRGIVYRDKGDLDRALTEFNEKVKLDPDAASGYSQARRPLSHAEGIRPVGRRLRSRGQDRARRRRRAISTAAGCSCSRTISTRPRPISTRRSNCTRTTLRRWSAAAW